MAHQIDVGWGGRNASCCLRRGLTSQYLYGNALLVQGDNYILAAGILLLSIALCYGLMWIGVIHEYRKFEGVIDEKIRYDEGIINAPLSAQLTGD